MDFTLLKKYCEAQLRPMTEYLRAAVEIESPSDSKEGLDRMAEFFAREMRSAGGKTQLLRRAGGGSAVKATFWGRTNRAQRPVLILGHIDTVWRLGTLSQMPFHLTKGRAYGPGVLDMKSGIICGLWAIRALRELKLVPPGSVRFFLNPDEEIGSRAFRTEIERQATGARACLVLEPAADGGALKTARKGVAEFRITVEGRTAHAGIEPEAGINAISEIARQIIRIESSARPRSGLTINAGVIEGGTRSNVVPEHASVTIDVRIPTRRAGMEIERKIRSLRPILPGIHLSITGGLKRPPMERRTSRALFLKAKEVGTALGMKLMEASTGGGSDGSFVAAMGVPTLDGLGGVGGGAHARSEHVILQELPRRAALIAALIASI